jgi:single-stranded DNA-binding protein
VVADNIQFLGSGAGTGNGEGGNGSSEGSAASSAGSSRSGGRAGQGQQTDEESYEDIPFAQGYDPGARIVRDIL